MHPNNLREEKQGPHREGTVDTLKEDHLPRELRQGIIGIKGMKGNLNRLPKDRIHIGNIRGDINKWIGDPTLKDRNIKGDLKDRTIKEDPKGSIIKGILKGPSSKEGTKGITTILGEGIHNAKEDIPKIDIGTLAASIVVILKDDIIKGEWRRRFSLHDMHNLQKEGRLQGRGNRGFKGMEETFVPIVEGRSTVILQAVFSVDGQGIQKAQSINNTKTGEGIIPRTRKRGTKGIQPVVDLRQVGSVKLTIG